MGQTELTAGWLTGALVDSIRRVAPGNSPIDQTTPLDRTGVDSMGLLEAMVHMEDVGLTLSEDIVRRIALEPDYDPAMSVGLLAELIVRLVATNGAVDGGPL